MNRFYKIVTDKAAVMKTGKVCQKTCNWNMPQNNYTVHHFTKDICTDNRYENNNFMFFMPSCIYLNVGTYQNCNC